MLILQRNKSKKKNKKGDPFFCFECFLLLLLFTPAKICEINDNKHKKKATFVFVNLFFRNSAIETKDQKWFLAIGNRCFY